MADIRAVVVVGLIVLSGAAVGAVAGFRMHLHETWNDDAPPALVNVSVAFPDGTHHNGSVVVAGSTANALGALEALAVDNFTVGVRETSFGVYVHTIGAFRAVGECGWLYSVGALGPAHQPDHAADRAVVATGDDVFWYWGCL